MDKHIFKAGDYAVNQHRLVHIGKVDEPDKEGFQKCYELPSLPGQPSVRHWNTWLWSCRDKAHAEKVAASLKSLKAVQQVERSQLESTHTEAVNKLLKDRGL